MILFVALLRYRRFDDDPSRRRHRPDPVVGRMDAANAEGSARSVCRARDARFRANRKDDGMRRP
ncbi:MAG: hypothetical protein ACOY82_11735 [Pseudomonadota bacterium]